MVKRGYHHGDLRRALTEAALSLIEAKGPQGFTLSEAAKEAGVTPAAVYRHFTGREDLIAELKIALKGIKTLQGLIPICAECRRIRDDEGSWTGLETYVREHSEADFSHGLCPECMQKIYGAERGEKS